MNGSSKEYYLGHEQLFASLQSGPLLLFFIHLFEYSINKSNP